MRLLPLARLRCCGLNARSPAQAHQALPASDQRKAEAFNKTLQREWAYRRPYFSNAERLDALPIFLQDYNYARPHTSIGNKPPASRL